MINSIGEVAFGVALVFGITSIVFQSPPGSCEEVADGQPSAAGGLLHEEMTELSRQPRAVVFTECCDGAQAKGCLGCKDSGTNLQLDCYNIDFFPTCSDTENVQLLAYNINVTKIPAGALDDFNADDWMYITTAAGVDVKLADNLFKRHLGAREFWFYYGGPGDFPAHAFNFSSPYVRDNEHLYLGYRFHTQSGKIPCGMFHDAYELKRVYLYNVMELSEPLFPNNSVRVKLSLFHNGIDRLVLTREMYPMAFQNTNIYSLGYYQLVCCGFAEAALADYPDHGAAEYMLNNCVPDSDPRCVNATLALCPLPSSTTPPLTLCDESSRAHCPLAATTTTATTAQTTTTPPPRFNETEASSSGSSSSSFK